MSSHSPLSSLPRAHVVVAIDFETADMQPDSACSVGMAKVVGGQVVDTFASLLRPPRQRVMFTRIHGLTWNMLKDSPTFGERWGAMCAFVQGATHFVAHNAPFDRRVLLGCCAAAGVVAPALPFICTVQASRRILRLPSHTLDAVCAHCGITFTHHRADEDAVAAAKVFVFLCERGLQIV